MAEHPERGRGMHRLHNFQGRTGPLQAQHLSADASAGGGSELHSAALHILEEGREAAGLGMRRQALTQHGGLARTHQDLRDPQRGREARRHHPL